MRRALIAIVLAAGVARADDPPGALRLRADVYASSAPGADAGLVTLSLDGRAYPWLAAEAMVWMGTEGAGALVIELRLRDPRGRGALRFGRFLESAGALRPVQLDGASATARLPWASSVEVFGGVPVELDPLAWDWVAGGRLARRLGDFGSVGIAYLQERTAGRLDAEEVGVDAGAAPLRWLDVGARLAWDLVDPGVADANVSLDARAGAWKLELFGSHLSPSRLLPATSLFTVLGDVPTDRVGASVRWRAAPRLDLDGTATIEGAARLVATLRLDDAGAGALALELRREPTWSGARATARLALPHALRAAAELEVTTDGTWGLASLGWRPWRRWDVAAAVEARTGGDVDWRLDALGRVTYEWGTR